MAESHLQSLATTRDFIKSFKKDKDFAGINISLSKYVGHSYIIAKSFVGPKPMGVVRIALDYFDPLQKAMIDSEVYLAMYDKPMPTEEIEAEMCSKTTDDS